LLGLVGPEHHPALQDRQSFEQAEEAVQPMVVHPQTLPQAQVARAAAVQVRLGLLQRQAQSTPDRVAAQQDIQVLSARVGTVAQDLLCCDTQTYTTN
jgi:hypothetical protein